MSAKPLFIPVRRIYFDQFAAGLKTYEIRCYGGRWTQERCTVGRAVIVSCGYRGPRLYGQVVGFAKIGRCQASEVAREIYPLCQVFARIAITLRGLGEV